MVHFIEDCRRRALILITGFAIAACANPGQGGSVDESKGPPPDPNRRPPPTQPGQAPWAEVWQQVMSCPQNKCPGRQGFGVLAGGQWYVGSSLDRSSKKGQLSIAEEETVSRAALAATSQALNGASRCSSVDSPPGTGTDIDLRVRAANSATVSIYEVSNRGRRICVRGEIEKAQALREALAPVIARYDQPDPQPSNSPSPRPSPNFPWPFPWP
ncbi:MAG TPA: hypothetical protein VM598_11700 [Bdellovibrionota bacterium]|nr:hypothetical protein [Bdellovibrionota bacterium]